MKRDVPRGRIAVQRSAARNTASLAPFGRRTHIPNSWAEALIETRDVRIIDWLIADPKQLPDNAEPGDFRLAILLWQTGLPAGDPAAAEAPDAEADDREIIVTGPPDGFYDTELDVAIRDGRVSARDAGGIRMVEVKSLIASFLSGKRRGRGRPRGAGSLEEADAAPLNKMQQLIDSKAAASVEAAATIVVNEDEKLPAKNRTVRGAGTPESKIRRLANRYREKFAR